MKREDAATQVFGKLLWDAILERPFGSMTKRELELMLIE